MSQFAAHGHRVFYVSTTRFLSSDASPRVLVKRIKDNVYEVQLAAARMPDVYGEVIEGNNKRTLLDALDELRSTYQINDAIGYVMIASWERWRLRRSEYGAGAQSTIAWMSGRTFPGSSGTCSTWN